MAPFMAIISTVVGFYFFLLVEARFRLLLIGWLASLTGVNTNLRSAPIVSSSEDKTLDGPILPGVDAFFDVLGAVSTVESNSTGTKVKVGLTLTLKYYFITNSHTCQRYDVTILHVLVS